MNFDKKSSQSNPGFVRQGALLLAVAAAWAIGACANLAAEQQRAITTGTIPTSVACIADLKNVDISSASNNTVVIVSDYYDINTYHGRGGGVFRWELIVNLPASPSPADDGGRFISPAVNLPLPYTGVWERMLQGQVPNVKMWGAHGDGVTDDFLAISNAINAIEADDGWSGELLFPAGVYMVTNTLIFNTDLVEIRGEHPAKSCVMMRTNYFADIFRTYNADCAMRGLVVDWDHHLRFHDMGLRFQSTGFNRANACLVTCQPGEASSINNIHTEYGAFGIRCWNSGAPGLRVRDVTVSDASIAGISVEPIPGQSVDTGDPVSFIGVSGDMRNDLASQVACLIRFQNSIGGGEISQIKAEGDFGGGVVQYTYPANQGAIGSGDHGYLEIHNCFYNAGVTTSGYFYTPAFLTLRGNNQTPDVSLHMLNLYACTQMINDEVGNRIVDADTQNFSGISQTAARQTISYNSRAAIVAGGTNTGRLVVGQTAFSYFYPTNGTGWYRVMQSATGGTRLSGKLVFGCVGYPVTEINVDEGWDDGSAPVINVTRCGAGMSDSPIVTMARGWYNTNGNCFVDLYVGNPVTSTFSTVTVPRLSRMTIAHDLNGDEDLDTLANQLVPVPYPVAPRLPAGSTSTVVNTYH